MPTDTETKVKENRLRRAAERQGLQVQKKRSYDPRAIGHGTYSLADRDSGEVVAGPGLSLDDVEAQLLSGEQVRAGDVSPAGWAPAETFRLLRDGYDPHYVARLVGRRFLGG